MGGKRIDEVIRMKGEWMGKGEGWRENSEERNVGGKNGGGREEWRGGGGKVKNGGWGGKGGMGGMEGNEGGGNKEERRVGGGTEGGQKRCM